MAMEEDISTRPPNQRLIWSGAILGSIAHAVFTCRCPDLSYEQSWDGTNYNVQDSAGSRGTIAFSGEQFVGLFFCETSNRNPSRLGMDHDPKRFLDNMPAELQAHARDDCFPLLLQDLNGTDVPIVTAAFWGDGVNEKVVTAEPWEEVLQHGAWLVRKQCLDTDAALAAWIEEFAMEPWEVELVRSLLASKLAQGKGTLQFNQKEQGLWSRFAQSKEGVDASRESFAEIGIVIP